MCLDGFRAGSMDCTGFLSPFSPLTETNPLIKLSGIKLKSQLSKRSITILTHTLTLRERKEEEGVKEKHTCGQSYQP